MASSLFTGYLLQAKEEAEEATSAPPKRRAQPQQRDEQRDEQRPSKQRPPKRGKRAELEKNQKETRSRKNIEDERQCDHSTA